MRLPLLLVAAPLALAACSQTADSGAGDTSAVDTTSADAMGNAATPVPANATGEQAAADPQAFVNAAAASDMFEIESGKLAQSKGKSAEVKDFGAMMVRDHTKSTADLKVAATTADVTPAPEMTAKQQSDLTALQGAGDNFDTLYKQQQLAAHEQALALLQGQASNGTAASLKAFAAKTAPVVQKHLEHVQRLP